MWHSSAVAIWRAVDGAGTTSLPGPTVVTIGNFDGVHLGHRHVLRRAVEVAESHADATGERPTVVPTVVAVTFDPHPISIFAPDRAPLLLSELPDRVALLRAAGADEVRVLAFDREMAGWTPDEFAQRVVVDELHAVAVVVGENFRYGHRAGGDVACLAEFGRAQEGAGHGFTVEGLPLDGSDDDYSSTLVRTALAGGDVATAAEVLGRWFALDGVVVTGERRGRDLGFPTANVPIPSGLATPADGVYAGWLTRHIETTPGQRWPAAISVGDNPTFEGADRRVEAYVLDAEQIAPGGLDLYGDAVTVEFVARLRGMERFDGLEPLVEQMHRDVADTRRILADPAD